MAASARSQPKLPRYATGRRAFAGLAHGILIQGKPNEVQVNDGTVPETQSSIHLKTLDSVNVTPAH